MAGMDFEVGETVWAKAKPKDEWWPCQKCDVPDGSNGMQDLTSQLKLGAGEHCVFFFGSQNFGKVKFIEKFEENFEQYAKKSKKKGFLVALEHVDDFKKGEDVGSPVKSPAAKAKTKPAAAKPSPSPSSKPAASKKTPPAKGKKGKEEASEEEVEEEEQEQEKPAANKKRKASEAQAQSNGKGKGKGKAEDVGESDSSSDSDIPPPPKKAAKAAAKGKQGGKKGGKKDADDDSDSEEEKPKGKAAEDDGEPEEQQGGKKQQSAFFNFCHVHRPKLIEAGVHITELSTKLHDMWEQPEHAAERKQLEEQYQAQLEKAKENEPPSPPSGSKPPKDKRAREESEKSALLERLTSLSTVLRKSSADLAAAIAKQTEELERLKKRPMPGSGAPSQAFLQHLKVSEVGRVVAKLKKHTVGSIKDRATELRLKWEELLEGSASVFSPKATTPSATPKGADSMKIAIAAAAAAGAAKAEGNGEEAKEGAQESGDAVKSAATNGGEDAKEEPAGEEAKRDGDVVMGEAAPDQPPEEGDGGNREDGEEKEASALEGVDEAALKQFEESDDEEKGKEEGKDGVEATA